MPSPASGDGGHPFPVSVKGVAVRDGRVLENERAEWEVPGGKLELGQAPRDCVVREIADEAGPGRGPRAAAGSDPGADPGLGRVAARRHALTER